MIDMVDIYDVRPAVDGLDAMMFYDYNHHC
jgi:hypothetical protein